MVLSIREANQWSKASKIELETLEKNIAQFKLKWIFLWNLRWLPLCLPRSQIEFKIFRLLFSKRYKINDSISKNFDFSLFLKESHEVNMVKIIDINPFKWVVIIGAIGVSCLEKQYGQTKCDHNDDIEYLQCTAQVMHILSV